MVVGLGPTRRGLSMENGMPKHTHSPEGAWSKLSSIRGETPAAASLRDVALPLIGSG